MARPQKTAHGSPPLGGRKKHATGAGEPRPDAGKTGSRREDIHSQIFNGRGGVMPTWGSRFDPQTIKALAVYIHANAGGQ